jgi:hypothetical protein
VTPGFGGPQAARMTTACNPGQRGVFAVLVCVPCGCGPACGGRAAKAEHAADAGPGAAQRRHLIYLIRGIRQVKIYLRLAGLVYNLRSG